MNYYLAFLYNTSISLYLIINSNLELSINLHSETAKAFLTPQKFLIRSFYDDQYVVLPET